MGVVRAENSDYSKNYGKNTEKDDKFSSKIHTPIALRPLSPGGSHQSRAENLQHFKSINLANG